MIYLYYYSCCNIEVTLLQFVTRSMRTVPNHTSGRWHFSLPVKLCNNILTSHASATARSSLVCFSCSWFLGHVRHARVASWLQMALVTATRLLIDVIHWFGYFCDIWSTNGPPLEPFQSVNYWCVFSPPLHGSLPPQPTVA